MIDAAPYKASPWGARFHALGQNEALGAGSAGPGKTTTLLADPYEQIFVEHERCNLSEHGDDSSPLYPYRMSWGDSVGCALHLRRTLKQLSQSITRAKKAFRRIDPGVSWKESDLAATFSSGFVFQFGHCKDPDDWENYFSLEFTHISFDELVQFEKTQYTMIRSRLRTVDPILRRMLKCRSMSNPLVQMDERDAFTISDPGWVRERFVDPHPDGNTEIYETVSDEAGNEYESTRIYLPAKLSDNPNKQFVRDYTGTLLSLDEHQREALYKGNWYFVPGAFFGKVWNEDKHTEQPFKINEEWPVFRSMDWGYKNFGTCLWGTLDYDDNLHVVYELTFREKDCGEVAEMVREVELNMGWWDNRANKSRLTGPADPQLWEERGAKGEVMAQTFMRKGVPWIPGARGNRRGSSQGLIRRLKDHRLGKTTPGIVFFKNCVQCIKTIPSLPSDPNDSEVPMDGGPDHWCDATRQMCSYVSRGRKGIAKMRPLREPWQDEDREFAEVSVGSDGYGGGL